MSTDADRKVDSGPLWWGAFFIHSAAVWLGLEVFGDNYLWVHDPVHPWIKDRLTPPLTTIINLPAGLLCGVCAVLLALAIRRLARRSGFDLRLFLGAALLTAFVAAMIGGNFVVITGPPGVRADNWQFRPLLERVVFSTVAATVLVAIEGAVLWSMRALARLNAADAPAAAS